MKAYRFFCGYAWTKNLTNSLGGARIGHYGFWFRIYGYGLHVSTRKKEDEMFSERYGLRKARYLLGVRFEVLTP